MKNRFEIPKMELSVFDSENIITASGGKTAEKLVQEELNKQNGEAVELTMLKYSF